MDHVQLNQRKPVRVGVAELRIGRSSPDGALPHPIRSDIRPAVSAPVKQSVTEFPFNQLNKGGVRV